MPRRRTVGGKSPRVEKNRNFPIVAFGASAGGLEAFTQVLSNLKTNLGMAYVLVPHIDSKHGGMLTTLLKRSTGMPVQESKNGLRMEPDHVYLLVPGSISRLVGGVFHMVPRAARIHLPIDAFFRSLAEDRKGQAIGVILSGLASDGVQGLEAIKAEGGIAICQEEETARYTGMPHSAIASGCVDFILPPERIGDELAKIAGHPYISKYATTPEEAIHAAPTNLQRVFGLLKKSSGVDFSQYKLTTIKRRIARRIALLKLNDLQDYVRYLVQNTAEVDALYQDLLIKVTGFFRDPGLYRVLKSKVLPSLIRTRAKDEGLRIWVPGCSTGEEAYSIAIVLMEALGRHSRTMSIQIFATDLSEQAVERARAGVYPASIAADVSAARLRRFFMQVDHGYQIHRPIREMCILARHDITRDPPFSRIDLISCRNVLIYLESIAQAHVISSFHYALKPGGILILGESEQIGVHANLFTLTDKGHKIYVKKPVLAPVALDHAVLQPPEERPEPERPKVPEGLRTEMDLQKAVDRILINRYAPAGVVVNEDLEILHFRGPIDPFLTHAPGKASFNLLKMVQENLLGEVRRALQRVKKARTRVRIEGVRVRREDEVLSVAIEAIPLRSSVSGDGYYLVLFDRAVGRRVPSSRPTRAAETRLVEQLKQEVGGLRESLQATVEEHEATTEEFKAANEEILSSNEELQSTNEELETAKEELESANEELRTLNEELQRRNTDLTQAHTDVTHLLASIQIPVVMVGRDQRIRRFTPAAEGVMNILSTDVGRPFTDIHTVLDARETSRLISDTIERGMLHTREVQDRRGNRYHMVLRPYRTKEGKVDGALILYIDADVFKEGTAEVLETQRLSEAVADRARTPYVAVDGSLVVKRTNASFLDIFGLQKLAVVGHPLTDLAWLGTSGVVARVRKVLANDGGGEPMDLAVEVPSIGKKTVRLQFDRMQPSGQSEGLVLLEVLDVR